MDSATVSRITSARQVVSLFRTAPEVTTKMEKVSKVLGLTPEEKAEFSRVAEAAGMTLGELIRALLRGYADSNKIRQ